MSDTSVADKTQQDVLTVRANFGVARLSDWSIYNIEGPDAAKFLQNRISNDVLGLQIGQGQLNASLDRQAKIEGVFSLHRVAPEQFWLVAPSLEAESAVRGIEKYHIVEQYKVQALPVALWSIQGSKAAECITKTFKLPLQALQESYSIVSVQQNELSLTVLQQTLSGEKDYILASDATQADKIEHLLREMTQKQSGIILDNEVMQVLRIEAGLPKFGVDYDTDTLLPETGLEREAVSYSKGCYLGQETVARVKTYGMLPKALTGLLFEPEVTSLPFNVECLIEGKPVGLLKSSAYSPCLKQTIAMAYLGKNERVPGKHLSLEIAGKTYPVTVTLLPFVEGQIHKSGQQLLKEGLQLFSEGYDEEAIRVLRLAIEAEPENLEAYECLGVILSRHDRYQEAIDLMEKVLMLDPDHVLAHTNLSVFYMKLGDKEKAEDEKAKATMAAFSKKAKESGLVFDIEAERRKKEEAALNRLAMFQEALKFNPEDPLGNFGLGSICLELKRYEEAVAPLQKVIQIQPKHSVAYLSLGKAFEGLNNPDKARDSYQKGIEVAAAKGDLMPLKEMQQRLENLK